MKKRIFIILLAAVCAATCALGLSACHKENPAGILKFTLNYDGESYSVSGYSGDYKEIKVVIPSKHNGKPVTGIAKSAFWARSDITGVTLPDTITSIGDSAFDGCSNIKSVVIPSSVAVIGEKAFSGCSSLTSITIPESVTYIGPYAFSGCSKLQYNIYDNAKYLGDSENPYAILMEASDKKVTSCTIHSNAKRIAAHAFYNCDKLASVTIGSSVVSIGDYAFSGCQSLGSIVVPDAVTSIGANAFANCVGVTDVDLGNSVESIGEYAFGNCNRIVNMTVPDTIVRIGSYAFSQCEDLEYNTYGNALYLGNSENPYVVLMKARNIEITSCTINENAKIIYDNAFDDCHYLESITIPDSVKGIGIYAFHACLNMREVVMGSSVAYLGKHAFASSGLRNVILPDSLTEIGWYAFGSCSHLQYSEYDNGKYLGSSENPYMALIEVSDSEITSYTVHENTKLIAGNAFNGCKSLTSVTVPSSVETINSGAFYYCGILAEITYEGTVAEWKSMQREAGWKKNDRTITVHCSNGNVSE